MESINLHLTGGYYLEEKGSRPKFAISDQRHLLSAQILGGCPFGVALLGEDAETNPCDLKASFSGLQIVGVKVRSLYDLIYRNSRWLVYS